jgi:hypothetical protein
MKKFVAIVVTTAALTLAPGVAVASDHRMTPTVPCYIQWMQYLMSLRPGHVATTGPNC